MKPRPCAITLQCEFHYIGLKPRPPLCEESWAMEWLQRRDAHRRHDAASRARDLLAENLCVIGKWCSLYLNLCRSVTRASWRLLRERNILRWRQLEFERTGVCPSCHWPWPADRWAWAQPGLCHEASVTTPMRNVTFCNPRCPEPRFCPSTTHLQGWLRWPSEERF